MAVINGVGRALDGFDHAFFAQEEAASYDDGTYLGQASSFGGPLEVEVVVQAGEIVSVQVLKHSDSPGFSDPAMSDVPKRIVAANNPLVDAASGATISSEAIMTAVQAALQSQPAVHDALNTKEGQ
jgi:fumarate reductase flavoprotein subunit